MGFKLDEDSLKKLILAYHQVDEITDLLRFILGDDWGEFNKLGSIWSDLYDVIEYHVGEDNIDEILSK